jgi:DNA-binding Lrp family transcriptional regulator
VDAHYKRGLIRAFLFLSITPGKEEVFLKKLITHEEVVEAHLVVGEYDVLAVLEFNLYGRGIYASAQDIVSRFVIEKIRRQQEVQKTNTIIPTLSRFKDQ